MTSIWKSGLLRPREKARAQCKCAGVDTDNMITPPRYDRRGAAYRDQFVCVSVCPRAYLWHCWTDLHNFSADPVYVAVAQSSVGIVAIRYVLPVLWMTSRLAAVGRMAMRGMLNL